jgi:hypothetical protein
VEPDGHRTASAQSNRERGREPRTGKTLQYAAAHPDARNTGDSATSAMRRDPGRLLPSCTFRMARDRFGDEGMTHVRIDERVLCHECSRERAPGARVSRPIEKEQPDGGRSTGEPSTFCC